MIVAVLLLVLVAGYATQRGGICAVVATRELVHERRAGRFLAFLLSAAIGLTLLAGAAMMGRNVLAAYPGSSAVLVPALGGAVFGVGAWVNGTCAFGTVAQLGSGRLARIATLAGFFAGSLLAVRGALHAPPAGAASPLAGWPPLLVLLLAGAVAGALAMDSGRLRRSARRRSWPPAFALGVIGIANAILLVLAARWPYTSLLMDLAAMTGVDVARQGLMALAFIAGAAGGALTTGGFRLAGGPATLWLRSAAGGAVMALGATLVPGGNDAMVLIGLPLLLPNLVAAYAAMAATLVAFELGAARFSPRE